MFRILREDTRVAVPDPIAAALRSGAPVELPEQILLVRKDGSELPIAGSGIIFVTSALVLWSAGALAELVYNLGDMRDTQFAALTQQTQEAVRANT